MIKNALKLFLKDNLVTFNIAHFSDQTQGLARHATGRAHILLPLSSETGPFYILKQL